VGKFYAGGSAISPETAAAGGGAPLAGPHPPMVSKRRQEVTLFAQTELLLFLQLNGLRSGRAAVQGVGPKLPRAHWIGPLI